MFQGENNGEMQDEDIVRLSSKKIVMKEPDSEPLRVSQVKRGSLFGSVASN